MPLIALATQGGDAAGPWAGFGRSIRSDSGGTDAEVVAAGDFNQDGKLDLAVGHLNQFKVGVLLGKGDGTFQPAINHALNSLAWSIAAADLNGDGKTDVVAGTRHADVGVAVLFGNGDGTLQDEADYPFSTLSAEAGNRTVARDFNADGRPDVAVLIANEGGFVSGINVLLNAGDGTLLPATNHLLGGVASGSPSATFAAADFNADGKPDLLTTVQKQAPDGSLSSEIVVLPGRGDGDFGGALRSPAISLAQGVVADFNRDGKLDVASKRGGEASGVVVHFGVGDGTFMVGPETGFGAGYHPYAVGDFNGDGDADLVLSKDFNGAVASSVILGSLGNGDGTFQPPYESRGGNSPRTFVVSDFNNDGRLDLATGYAANYVSVSLNSVITPEPCRNLRTETVLTDPTGDTTDGVPGHDIQSLSVAERLAADGEQVMVFILKVAALSTIPENTTWSVAFDLPYAFYVFDARSSGGTIITAGAETTFNADGTINIIVPRSHLDMEAGEDLTNIRATTRFLLGEIDTRPDMAPQALPSSASYTPGGTNPCATPTPTPTATPSATPTRTTPTPSATPTPAPLLLTEEATGKAVALDSVTFARDPFTVRTAHNFSPDGQTRVILFAANLELLPGEETSAVTAQAEDSQQRVFPLAVEHVTTVAGFGWLKQVVVRLPDELAGAGDVQVSLSLRGVVSNKAPITINAGTTSLFVKARNTGGIESPQRGRHISSPQRKLWVHHPIHQTKLAKRAP